MPPNGFNFKRRQHAELAVEAAKERAAGVVRSVKVTALPKRFRRNPLAGVTQDEVTFGNSVQVEIWASPAPGQPLAATGLMVEAWFDWIAENNPRPIENNTDVDIVIAEHGAFRIKFAACGPRDRGNDAG